MGYLLATSLTLVSAARAEGPRIPVAHATGSTSFCARAFPAIPGNQTCIDPAFRDFDLWVFRDSSATATIAYESGGLYDAGVPPTPLAAQLVSGSLTPAELTKLRDLLAESRIGAAVGHCNPIPPVIAVPSTFPKHSSPSCGTEKAFVRMSSNWALNSRICARRCSRTSTPSL